MAEARSHFHKNQQEHFARFPAGCPLDNDAFIVHGRWVELEKRMQQIRGEMGAHEAKRRKVNLASNEAAAKMVHACRWEASKIEQARLLVTDGVFARAVALPHVNLTDPVAVPREPRLFAAQAGERRKADCAAVAAARVVEQLPC